MARRIDIELTSRRDDGSWTWRAPGARQPRGTVDAGVVPAEAQVGDVLRADAEIGLDGIAVTAVLPPRPDGAGRDGPERIEVVGTGRGAAGVSVVLAPGGRRGRDGERGRPDGERRPRREPGGAGGRGPRREAGVGADRGPRREAAPGADRGPRREAAPGGDRGPRREAGAERPGAPGGRRPHSEGRPATGRRPAGDRAGAERRGPDRTRRFQPSTEHRNAALAALRPEQLPVAEQLLRGGVPAVRAAIEEQNSRARTEGRPEVTAEPLLAMAEELLPVMNLATWKDRAVAARAQGRDVALREVRSIVAAATTVTLDDEARELATSLRQALEARVTALREAWVARITTAVDEGRVADALRLSARPPEPATRLPAELAVRLAQAAGAAMHSGLEPSAWRDLLDAVVVSPVRRTVRPVGLPPEPGPELIEAARKAAGSVPELARLLGLPIPPPPGPRRPAGTGAAAVTRRARAS